MASNRKQAGQADTTQATQAPALEVPQSLAGALLVAQASINGVGKDARNQFHKYSYTSAEGMIAACRQALHGAGLVFSRIGWELSPDGQTVASEFLLQHPASNSVMSFQCPWLVVVEKGRPVDKALAGALTTSMGYFLRDLLLLPREDEDGSMDRRNDDPKGQPPSVGFRQQPPAPRAAPSQLEQLNAKLKAPQAPQAEQLVREQVCVQQLEKQTHGGRDWTVATLDGPTGVRQVVVPDAMCIQVVPLAGGMAEVEYIMRGELTPVMRSIKALAPAEEVADELPF